ncbi:hypothetical protein RO3G_01570 [Rhizopus delemar RA 99-880]|uniref:Uncharacterized protein n=1 Tax=Rhizopus delemar (strain RA 99-880 / ATCC MYA-4621 / FGSC 9543 / NRRL 43880) TaxID=246409 RepID=I1BKY6_RHIO9|nr:hypothetical protein RO3G_01570 [Rhizopus delemar RA 99-880]|eukprot:EIE76866.1 hypothetical protein RO3G_01570 [Rhizopus delemar RA 99-880]
MKLKIGISVSNLLNVSSIRLAKNTNNNIQRLDSSQQLDSPAQTDSSLFYIIASCVIWHASFEKIKSLKDGALKTWL